MLWPGKTWEGLYPIHGYEKPQVQYRHFLCLFQNIGSVERWVGYSKKRLPGTEKENIQEYTSGVSLKLHLWHAQFFLNTEA